MTILIVDDNETNLLLLASLTKQFSTSEAKCMTDPVAALTWCTQNRPGLVLVDYRMPIMSGTEFIRALRDLPGMHDIPIIMITTESERSVRQEALMCGATDFLSKPLDTIELRLKVRNLLALGRAQLLVADRAALLEHEVKAATATIMARERELVSRLARAAEFRDPETGAHVVRMARYSALIAERLGLPPAFQQMVLEAAPMHDVGKLATPDHILLKPGRLDPDEMAIMRRHAAIGAGILSGSNSPLLQLAEQIARGHHEKFDGSGYPAGVAGEAIPLAARIVAVADVFDALTSERPYKKAWPIEAARKFIAERSGTHFCPRCVDAFLGAWDAVLAIRAEHPECEDLHGHPA